MLRLAAGDGKGVGVASLPEGAENVAIGICPWPNDARALVLSLTQKRQCRRSPTRRTASWCHVRASSEGGEHDDELKAGEHVVGGRVVMPSSDKFTKFHLKMRVFKPCFCSNFQNVMPITCLGRC